MEYIYERKINYYETDKMGVVHHSNYIRFLEEARCSWMDNVKMPFVEFEKRGITIPVLGVNCEYKYHVTFDDIIQIKLFVKEYTGVRLTMGYNVINKKDGKTVLVGETKHCFTSKDLRPLNLKKVAPEFGQKFEEMKNN